MPEPTNADHERWLVQQAIQDPDAFQELYQLYFRRVYAYVASRIGNQQDAEDVVSEIFMRVSRNLDQLRNQQDASFAAWLFVIARHAITDHYRRNGHSENHASLDITESLAAVDSQPEKLVIESEDAARLYRLIVSLPERKREIITLRYYGGLRNHEIASVLGIGEKTVAAYLSRALDELQEKYKTSDNVTKAAEDVS
jgi:RNA polymerase sigma-70 factor (ECF subfamily)